jgi:hypothetical protein
MDRLSAQAEPRHTARFLQQIITTIQTLRSGPPPRPPGPAASYRQVPPAWPRAGPVHNRPVANPPTAPGLLTGGQAPPGKPNTRE